MATPLFEKFLRDHVRRSELSLETCTSNLKSVAALTVLNWSDWPFRCTQTETQTNRHIERTHYLRHSLRSLGRDKYCKLIGTDRQKFTTSQHLNTSRCWALALRCGKFLSVGGVVQHVRSRCPCSGVWHLVVVVSLTSSCMLLHDRFIARIIIFSPNLSAWCLLRTADLISNCCKSRSSRQTTDRRWRRHWVYFHEAKTLLTILLKSKPHCTLFPLLYDILFT